MVRNKKSELGFSIYIQASIILYLIIVILPLLYVVANSFSSPDAVYTGRVYLWPVDFSVEAYQKIFNYDALWTGYKNTILYTVVFTVISLVLQFTAGYAFSKRDLRFKSPIMFFYILTMFINGGMIPTYLIVQQLHLLNTMWAIVLPGCFGVFNAIIVRTYINSMIPYEVQESAGIDGAGPIRIFLWIILPLCLPILAVQTLFAVVAQWNSFFNALIYVSDRSKHPLQLVLQRLLVSNDTGDLGLDGALAVAEKTKLAAAIKYAVIIVANVPILILYPFFEKYFDKGMVLGTLKG